MSDPLPVRVGVGYDSHRFAPGGPLILGGVRIQADVHLHGHSDGDAICHAVTDAILGAAALGDIGSMFSDTDSANAGRDSIQMLELAVAHARRAGWRVGQLDVVVVAESPKIAPHRTAMREPTESPSVGRSRSRVGPSGSRSWTAVTVPSPTCSTTTHP